MKHFLLIVLVFMYMIPFCHCTECMEEWSLYSFDLSTAASSKIDNPCKFCHANKQSHNTIRPKNACNCSLISPETYNLPGRENSYTQKDLISSFHFSFNTTMNNSYYENSFIDNSFHKTKTNFTEVTVLLI